MRKVIAAINMTIDGVCDHTALDPDAEIHDHYTSLLNTGDVILYGRTTYELMQFWQTLLQNPSEQKSMNDFASSIDRIHKIVFSQTLKSTGWNSAELATKPIEQVVRELKQQPGKDIFVGSRSLIIQLMNLSLVDELQLCIHPLLAGKGLPLFENVTNRIIPKHTKTKNFEGGAVILYYEPIEKD